MRILSYYRALLLGVLSVLFVGKIAAQNRTITRLDELYTSPIAFDQKVQYLTNLDARTLANSVLVFEGEYFAMQMLQKHLLEGQGRVALACAFSPEVADSREIKALSHFLKDAVLFKKMPTLVGTRGTYQSLYSQSLLADELSVFLKKHVPELYHDSLLSGISMLVSQGRFASPEMEAAYQKQQVSLKTALEILPTLYPRQKSAAQAWAAILADIEATRKGKAAQAVEQALPALYPTANLIYFGAMPKTATPALRNDLATSIEKTVPIKGTLIDATTKQPISQARISVQRWYPTAYTDAAGNFSLAVPLMLADEVAEVAAVGYESKEFSLLEQLMDSTGKPIVLKKSTTLVMTDDKGKPMDAMALHKKAYANLAKNHLRQDPQATKYYYRHTRNNTEACALLEGYKLSDVSGVAKAITYNQNLRVIGVTEGNEALRKEMPAQFQTLLAQDVVANSESVLRPWVASNMQFSASQLPMGSQSVYALSYANSDKSLRGTLYLNAEDFAVVRHVDTLMQGSQQRTSWVEYTKVEEKYALNYALIQTSNPNQQPETVEWLRLMMERTPNTGQAFVGRISMMDIASFQTQPNEGFWNYLQVLVSRVKR